MTDFDCINATCDEPVKCLQREGCIQRPERTRVKEIIEDTRDRLRREK